MKTRLRWLILEIFVIISSGFASLAFKYTPTPNMILVVAGGSLLLTAVSLLHFRNFLKDNYTDLYDKKIE